MDDRALPRSVAGVAPACPHAGRRRLIVGSLAGGLLAVSAGAASFPSVAARRLPAAAVGRPGGSGATEGKLLNDCPVFPEDNYWNTPIDGLPVDDRSDDYVASIGPDTGLHPDFGSGLSDGGPLGIPLVRVPADQPEVDATFVVEDESDPGPYPIPPDAPIEGGASGTGDRHLIVVQEETCRLFELYDAVPRDDGSWEASSGARFDLTSNDLRPEEWTSADAAGLPILPGLVRYEEIDAGVIPHALRFTASVTQAAYVWPARHQAGATDDATVPPLGQRFRLRDGIDTGDFSPTNRIILEALRTYGMVLADNGSDWFLSGSPDDRWDNDDLHELQERIHGSDFEAVDCSSLMIDPDSGRVA